MSNPLPIFPLGDMVLYPGVVTEFYIFEPRYVQMVEHCLDSKGQFCFATLIGNWKELYHENPEMHTHGCVCSIEEYQKHSDGKYSILVKGLYKAEIREIPSEQLYRISQPKKLEYIDDITSSAEDDLIVRNFIKRVLTKQLHDANEDSINSIIDDMELGKFLSILSFQSKLSTEKKLEILKESSLKKIFMEISQAPE